MSALILAPLRGVTIRAFRENFLSEILAAGFTEAITPFIPASAGVDALRNPELRGAEPTGSSPLRITPQFIGKDPLALRACLKRVREAGYDTADLNAGCPYPMVRNKGRGSGLLRSPELLRQMLQVGCEEMGPGKFSVKARLGIDRNDELLALMPIINRFPLRFLTVHARTAKAMYGGECDREAFREIAAVARVPLVANGDIEVSPRPAFDAMIGRSFIRDLARRDDARELVLRYIERSRRELSGDVPVVGRMKELLGYWKELPNWKRKWSVIKICHSVDEMCSVI